jgi:hypothetical protein
LYFTSEPWALGSGGTDAETNFKKLNDHQVVKLVEDLQDNKRIAAEALEQNVFAHYPEFIVVSKEIARTLFRECSCSILMFCYVQKWKVTWVI